MLSIAKRLALFSILLICYVQPSMAEVELLSHTDKTFNARLVQDSSGSKESDKLLVSGSGHSKSTVFSVPDPSRIVIDLIGAKIRKNKDFTVKGSALIKSVRFGYHRDKIRIVIDLKENKNIPYRVTESNGKLTLTIENAKKEIKEVKKEEIVKEEIILKEEVVEEVIEIKETPVVVSTLTRIPTATATKIEIKETATAKPAPLKTAQPETGSDSDVFIEDLIEKKPAATSTPVSTKTPLPTVAPKITTAAPSPTIAAKTEVAVTESLNTVVTENKTAPAQTSLPTTQSLKSIAFAYTDNLKSSPVIKIDLANKSQFELKKADDKLYILTIKDCREFKSELKYVNFPPHDFVGFTYVQADPENFDINIRIGVERGKRITATPNENQIWVSLLQEEKIETRSAPVPGKKAPTSARPGPSVAR